MATRYKDLREDHDLLQKDIAKILEVTPHTYGDWERCTNDMPLEKCNNLANYYETTIDYLIGLSNKNVKVISNYKINWETLRKRLRESRKEKRISQTFLGDKVGLAQGTYSDYEVGRSKITAFKLMNIAEFLDISMDYIVGRTNNKKIAKRKKVPYSHE